MVEGKVGGGRDSVEKGDQKRTGGGHADISGRARRHAVCKVLNGIFG